MSYDHVDRMGNEGDVVKHVVLCRFVQEILTWGSHEAQRVFVDGAEKYWFTYFDTACKRPNALEDFHLWNP